MVFFSFFLSDKRNTIDKVTAPPYTLFTMNGSPILPIGAVGYLGRGVLVMFIMTVLHGLIFGRAVVELYCEHLPLHHESVAVRDSWS